MPAIRIEIQGQSFDAPLPEAPVSIGKAADVDLCIQGDGVAQHHCVLEPLGGGRTKLKDLGSGSETLVNGVAIKQISLNDGDVIQVGAARITYLATAAGAPAEPAAVAARPKAAKPKAVSKSTAAARPKAAAKPKPAVASDATSKDAPASNRTTERSTSTGEKAADDTPTEDKPAVEKPSASAPSDAKAEDAVTAAPGARTRKEAFRVPLVGLLAGVLVLVGVWMFTQGLDQGDDASLERGIKEGHRLFEAQDYDTARRKFQRVLDHAPEGGPFKGKATDGLSLVGAAVREMDAALERLRSERLVLTQQALGAERTRFLEAYGELQAGRFDRTKASILAAQSEWKTQNLEATQHVVADLVDKAEFARALEAWQGLAAKSPAAIDVEAEVQEAIAELGVLADAKAAELMARADRWNKSGTAYNSVKLFDDMLTRFKGFAAEAELVQARATAKALSEVVAPTQPSPTRPSATDPRPTDPTPGTTDPTKPPPVAPSVEDALRKRADALLAEAATAADTGKYRDGAAKLAAAARSFPEGTQKARVLGQAEDYGLAARGKSLLIADIKAASERYANVRLAPRLKASLIDADDEYVHAKVSGGRSKHAWSRLPASIWPGLLKRLGATKDTALPAAGLLHAVGQDKDAEATLVIATEKGVPADTVFATLARWRSIPVPEGGFVVYQGRYVTPTERDDFIREEQIVAALKLLDSKRPGERKAAADALFALGEAAAPRFKGALERRRAFLIDELVRSKSFGSGKYKAKLLGLLAERRKHALALIYDAAAYPYPNPQKKNQKEVEARVDQVREVWERPFDLVAQWDSKLQERLTYITEVDEFLAQVDPSFQPDLDALKARINKAIDVPASSDPGKREYSLAVMLYNTTLPTTATGQEKENVRSVNDYRMMMGLLSVKIDEKLTRAARGHSRHMATHQYFAHNVPAPYAKPTNRTPGIRAKQQGFGGGVGENIARGPGTGHGAFMAWFRSSGHHRNMLGRGWLVMGCGRAAGTWWTQLFAGGSKSLKTPDPLPAPAAPFAPDPEGKGDGGRPGSGADEPGDETPGGG